MSKRRFRNRLIVIPEVQLPKVLSECFKEYDTNPLQVHAMDDVVDRFHYEYGLNDENSFEVTERDLQKFVDAYTKPEEKP